LVGLRQSRHFQNLFWNSLHWVFTVQREDERKKKKRTKKRDWSLVGWQSNCLLVYSAQSSGTVMCFRKLI
jgi:hypothetical protein